MTRDYDLVVIGAGSAGLIAAGLAARLGVRVVIVERDRIGGDCTWTGCIPSKALLHAAQIAQNARRAPEFGISVGRVAVDFPRVMGEVRRAIEGAYALETPEVLAEHGIESIAASARFLDPNTIEAGSDTIRASRFLICTGAEPSVPAIPGLDRIPYLTYERVFELERQPESLIALGAGPAGCEIAQAFSRLGTRVTLVEEAGRILPIADPEASQVLSEQFAEEGMVVRTGFESQRVTASRKGVEISSGGEAIGAQALLVATGRRPRVAGLDLDRAGVLHDGGGISVDRRLRTSQPHIYAAGDVTGSFQFTHYAGWQGFRAARNALLPGGTAGKREHLPWVVFTDPEVAQVGLSEAEAGSDIRVDRRAVGPMDRALTRAETRGFVKVLSRGGRLVGATLVLAQAAELVNELALVIDNDVKLAALAGTIHAYPSYGTAVQQLAAELAVGQATRGLRGRVLRAVTRR